MQDLWKSRQKPTALHLDNPQLAGLYQHHHKASNPGQEPGGQVSACRSLGMRDQHKDWSLLDKTQVSSTAKVTTGPQRQTCAYIFAALPPVYVSTTALPPVYVSTTALPLCMYLRSIGRVLAKITQQFCPHSDEHQKQGHVTYVKAPSNNVASLDC